MLQAYLLCTAMVLFSSYPGIHWWWGILCMRSCVARLRSRLFGLSRRQVTPPVPSDDAPHRRHTSLWVTVNTEQGRRHEVLIGGGGFMGIQTHLPQKKLSFSSDFRHFILKLLENSKLYTCQEKGCSNIINSSPGTSPMISRMRGTRPPSPPPRYRRP